MKFINPTQKILLYAGGSLGTNEFEHLLLFENAIEKGKFKNLNVVYRPHPWGGGGNAGDQISSYKWKYIKFESSMTSYLNSLKKKGYHLTFPNYSDTHVVLSHVDYVISPLSTILIEAGIHKKPIMCFLPMEDIQAKHFQTVHNLPHFREFQNADGVVLASNRRELIEKVNLLIKNSNDPSFKQRIYSTCKYFVAIHKDPYSKRILNLAGRIVKGDHKCFS